MMRKPLLYVGKGASSCRSLCASLLASYPNLGRARDEDLRPGLRSFPVGEYVIIYR